MKKETVEVLQRQNENFQSEFKSLKQKELIVKNLLSNNSSKSSFYLNRLAASKPSSIIFSAIVFQPLKKNIRTDKPIEFKKEELVIQGQSADKIAFSNWIDTLEKFKWASSILVTDYDYQNKTNHSYFSIKIKIVSDESKQ